MAKFGTRGVLCWAAYPGGMAMALAFHVALLSAGLPIVISAYVAAVVGAAAVTLLEFVIPYDRAWRPKWYDVKHDLAFMVAVQMVLPQALALLFGVTLLRYLATVNLSLPALWPDAWPIVAQVALMLSAAEFFRYWLHVAAHNTDVLWRLHAVHHSPKKLYWLNVGRFHPVEKALQYLFDALPFIVVGVGEDVLAAYFVFYAVNGFFQHSNVDARYGVLNYLISGAELHRWHHSRLIEESNTNYGNNLIVWDLVFGTWFLPADRRVGELGLLNRDYPLGFLGQMSAPLTPGLDKKGANPQ